MYVFEYLLNTEHKSGQNNVEEWSVNLATDELEVMGKRADDFQGSVSLENEIY